MNTKDRTSQTTKPAIAVEPVLPPVIYCTCKKVECYRSNGLSQLICGICDKPLNKEQSADVGRSIASYYGW